MTMKHMNRFYALMVMLFCIDSFIGAESSIGRFVWCSISCAIAVSIQALCDILIHKHNLDCVKR